VAALCSSWYVRVRAYQREKAWAPRYVADELAGTTLAAAQHRATAALRAAEAASTTDAAARAGLEREAADAAALADVLDAHAAQLEAADTARAHWLAHTAETRAAADRASLELSARRRPTAAPTSRSPPRNGSPNTPPRSRPTPHTGPSATTPTWPTRDADTRAVAGAEVAADAAEAAVPDLRDVAAVEPAPCRRSESSISRPR
jgi:hypothetical protein